ncbi:MAG: prepilin-type N-terminal cleavage/methylation domain-containing protein [Candidatus Omnitrophica bacterium]|nr:prepilin-type N-terminal cleavage/methylation domain-containing protein [Candidatus Omnitrophota bacterium]
MPRLFLSKKAFSLVELIITIIVLAIVGIPLSLLLSGHVLGTLRCEELALADNLARFEMEVLYNMPYEKIESAHFLRYQGYDLDAVRTVEYVHGSGLSEESTKKIIVEMRKPGSPAALARYATYLSKNIQYPY